MSETLDSKMSKLLSVLEFREAMNNFKKKYYEDFFYQYRKSVSDVTEEIIKMYASETKEEEMDSAAKSLVSYAKDRYEHVFFLKKSTELIDMQCMMVFYALPAILKIPSEEDSRHFTDVICKTWSETFPKETISAATYEEIYAGFRTTIFGFNVEGIFGDKNGKG